MLNKIWKMKFGACKNIGVTSRHSSPSAISAGIDASRRVTSKSMRCRMKTPTQSATIVAVAGAVAAVTERTFRCERRASATHSGQC
jgi:hypothetical protein